MTGKKENEQPPDDEPKDVKPPEPSSIEGVEIVKGDGHLDEVINAMPEVVEDAIDAAKAKDAAAQDVIDGKGRKFDPSQHATDQTGKPVLTPTGRFKKINLPKGQTGNKINTVPQQSVVNDDVNRQAAAIVAARMFIQCGLVFFGDEWQPEKSKDYDEEQYLTQATDEYFKTAGIVDMPPWLVLVVAYGSYGLKRINKPKTKSVLQKWGEKIKYFGIGLWAKFKGKQVNARSHSGDNTKRKDDASV